MQQPLNSLDIAPHVQIPTSEFDFSFARSGGPGGQNVNKVNSKAVLRWNVVASPSMRDDVRARFLETYGSRVTTDGELVLSSQTYRDQPSNIDECLRKLSEMLQSVAYPPKHRRATKPTKASKVRRVETKARTGVKKANRKRPRMDD